MYDPLGTCLSPNEMNLNSRQESEDNTLFEEDSCTFSDAETESYISDYETEATDDTTCSSESDFESKGNRAANESSNVETTSNPAKKHLKVIYTNSDCLLNKLDELSLLTERYKPDIIVVCEVLPKNFEVKPSEEIYHLDTYTTYSNVTKNDVRGILVYVEDGLAAATKEVSFESDFNESVCTYV